MDHLQPLVMVFIDQVPVPADVVLITAVFGDDDFYPVVVTRAVSTVGEFLANLQNAFEAGSQVLRPVRRTEVACAGGR